MKLNENHHNISKLTDQLFRYESGKLVSVLTKIFGIQNLELAEDVVQETFISALQAWRIKGVPSASGNIISTYHLEAAIAYEHCTAPTFDKTNWLQILTYYNLLEKLNPTAIIMLNRAAVVYRLNGAEKALSALQQSPWLKEWERHYLYHSLLGEIYVETDKPKAKASFEKAITLTRSEVEQKLLRNEIAQL